MNNLPNQPTVPEWYKFVKSTFIIFIITVAINATYYYLFDLLVKTPIPEPYSLIAVCIQTLIVVLLNGFIHYKQRVNRNKNTFGYVSTIIILLATNLVFCIVTMDIRRTPSINEMIRLYGVQLVPDILLFLSVPIAIFSFIGGMFGIPAIINKKRSEDEVNLAQTYRMSALQFLKVHLIISILLIVANILYFSIYSNLVKNVSDSNFSLVPMVQMTLVTTALAILLYIFISEYGKQGLSVYIMLSFCFTIAAFLTSLPRPNGQPIYDNSLWLHIPLAIFSLIAEIFGIPYLYRNLERDRKERESKDRGWH